LWPYREKVSVKEVVLKKSTNGPSSKGMGFGRLVGALSQRVPTRGRGEGEEGEFPILGSGSGPLTRRMS